MTWKPTPDQLARLRRVRDRAVSMACRAYECPVPPTVVVEYDGLYPFCEVHGEIMAELNATIALPIDRYCLDDFATGFIFLGRRE